MKRNEFLSELSYELEGLPQKVRTDMLHDYDDHFASGLQQGRTEEEIAGSLGNPRALGRELRNQYTGEYNAPPPPPPPPPMYPVRPRFSILRFLWMTFVMGMFNLILILGPYLGLLGVLIGFWGAAVGFGIGGVGAMLATFIPFAGDAQLIFTGSGLSFITIMAGAVTCTTLGILLGLGCWYTTKAFFKMTVKYISWNFRVIIGRRY